MLSHTQTALTALTVIVLHLCLPALAQPSSTPQLYYVCPLDNNGQAATNGNGQYFSFLNELECTYPVPPGYQYAPNCFYSCSDGTYDPTSSFPENDCPTTNAPKGTAANSACPAPATRKRASGRRARASTPRSNSTSISDAMKARSEMGATKREMREKREETQSAKRNV